MSEIKTGFDVIQNIISGKWKSIILYHLGYENKRTKDLLQICEGVSHKVLNEQLKQLQMDGLINRTVFPEVIPIKVEYSLTSYGRSFLPLLKDMCDRGDIHFQKLHHQSIQHKVCQL